MTNDYDPQDDDLMYDDTIDDLTDDEAIEMLCDEGYSYEEAKRMVVLYDADDDDICYGSDDLDRDVPDYTDDEDRE